MGILFFVYSVLFRRYYGIFVLKHIKMAAKISKDELAVILKGIFEKGDYDEMQEQIEKVADEYGIDLTSVEEEDVEIEDVSSIIEDDSDLFHNDFEEEDDNY